MLNPHHLATFDAVLRTGSFAGAARTLGYTAPAVSQQITALEHDLGAVLFERAARSVTATAAADALAGPARRLLALLDGVQAEFAGWASGRSGHLRIGGFPTANRLLLPGLLARLGRRAPDATVTLVEAEPPELLRDLHEGRIDLALVYEYDGVPLDPRRPGGPRALVDPVDAGLLLRESLVLLTTSPAAGTAGRPVTLADLRERPWVATGESTLGWHLLRRACLEAGFTPRVVVRSNDYGVLRALVERGIGVALVPALAVEPGEGVAVLPLAGLRRHRRIRVLHAGAPTNPLLTAAIGALGRAARELTGRPGVVVGSVGGPPAS